MLSDNIGIPSIVLRLLLAVICGGIIGFERGKMRRAAGFRTHILVCLGSAIAMLTNQYIVEVFHSGDMSRIGAQVISGIGFLGAGTIIVTNNQRVRGLTTAAGLWASACMGLAIGIGFYRGALIGCFFIFLVITIFHRLDDWFVRHSNIRDLYIELENITSLRKVFDYLKEHEYRIYSYEFTKSKSLEGKASGIVISIRIPYKFDQTAFYEEISNIDGITYVDELA